MVSELQFQIKADEIDMEVLWKALTTGKFEVAQNADPDLVAEWQILEGDGQGNIVLGSLLRFRLGPDMEPLTERIVELDETNHLVKFQGIGGGFTKLGFAYYALSIKIDSVGEGNSTITTTFNYDLEKGVDGAQLLEEFSNLLARYFNRVMGYLQQKNNA